MKIYGVIGFPIGHSASPLMQTAAFRAAGIQSSIYVPFEVSPDQLKDIVRAFRVLHLQGFNVTIPHKEKIFRFLDGISSEAKLIGAVNTVKNVNGRLHGYNTDAPGFLKSLDEDLKFKPQKKNCMVIGAGGAGRAIAFALAQGGAGRVHIYDIDKKRTSSLARHIKKNFPQTKVLATQKLHPSIFGDLDLIVNATPLGMKKKDPLPIDASFLHKGLSVYDVVYNPSPTKLVKKAKQKGLEAVNGLGMLLYQGALAFKIWTGKNADIAVMKKALITHLK